VARTWAPVATQIPLGFRRRGPVVAFLGPDGAGKGTIIEAISRTLPVANHVYYLGSARAAQGDRTHTRRSRYLPLRLREPLFVVKKLLRAGRVLVPAYANAWRGGVVLFDRHPLEALATRPRVTRAARELERRLLRHVVPTPDLIVVLDAPTDVLLQRKREHPAAVLDRWRTGFSEAFADVEQAFFCSTEPPLEDVTHAVRDRIWKTLAERRRWP
jgi:thymidylate kinase